MAALNTLPTYPIHIADCIWRRNSPADGYTHLRLLQNGWKKYDYKASFCKRSSGGSTGWDFTLDGSATYSIEVYTSSMRHAGVRRMGMNWEEYEVRTIRADDFQTVFARQGQAYTASGYFMYEVQMGRLGVVDLHIEIPSTDVHDNLTRANTLTKAVPVAGILKSLDSVKLFIEPLSIFGDIISDVHPIGKAIVGSFHAIYNVLKGVSELNSDICSLLEEMCAMLDHVDKIKGCLQNSAVDDFKDIFVSMENLMGQTCHFVQCWNESRNRKGLILTALSREQIKGVRSLKSEFSHLKSHLDRQIAVDTLVRTRLMSDALASPPSHDSGVEKSRSPPPPQYHPWADEGGDISTIQFPEPLPYDETRPMTFVY